MSINRKQFLAVFGSGAGLTGCGGGSDTSTNMTSALASEQANAKAASVMAPMSTSAAGFGINVLDYISTTEWAAIANGSSSTNVASGIQSAINAAIASNTRVIFFPAGTYIVNTTLSIPAGRISLIGEGLPSEETHLGGTILKSTAGNTILQVGSGTGKAPNFWCEGMHFMGETTSALVVLRYCPASNFVNCGFVNLTGDGLELNTCYTSTLDKVHFNPNRFSTSAGSNAAVRTKVASGTSPGGLLTFRDVSVGQGFAYGLFIGSSWQQMSLQDSEFAGSKVAVFADAGIDALNISGCYFEGTCQAFVADAFDGAAKAGIRNFTFENCWMLGGGLSGGSHVAAISLSNPSTVHIANYFMHSTTKPLLHIASKPSGWYSAYAGSVSYTSLGGNLYFSSAPSFQIYQGQRPTFLSPPSTISGVII